MAGYDFTIGAATPDEDAFIRRLLIGLQLQLRRRFVTLNYRRNAEGYHVTVDGPLINIQASLDHVAIMLAGMADAIPSPMLRRQRVRIGHRVLRANLRGAFDSTQAVLEVARTLGMTPGSFAFEAVGEQVIDYRLYGLTNVLQMWNGGQATSEQALEELHATAELLMGWVLGDRWDDRAYSEQAAEMVRRGQMSEGDRDALIGLKDKRRSVRHHRGLMERSDLEEMLPKVLAALHRLVRVSAAD